MEEKHKCPVCMQHEFEEYGSFDFCPICGSHVDGYNYCPKCGFKIK